MKVILYTLPTCSICHMVKAKLQQKNIQFEERDFQEIINVIQGEYAPALRIIKNSEETIYNTPSQIVKWINEQ